MARLQLDPTLDLVFKLLLTRNEQLLVDMLEGILAKPIAGLTILNPGIPGALTHDRSVVLDIRVLLADGSRVDVEMQIRTPPTLGARLVYYGARDFSDQLRRGEDYHLLTPTVVVAWLCEPLFPELDRLHLIFELRERESHMLLGDQLSIHVLQLSALSPSAVEGYDGRVERWARFFVARDDAERERLAKEDPIMALAHENLEQLSQDPATYSLAREREDALKLYEMDLMASRAEGERKGRAEGERKGRAEGEAKGRAEILLKLLGLRFGPTSEATRARVDAATLEQLDTWAERVLTAQSIEEVLAT